MDKVAIDLLYQGYFSKVYQHTHGYIAYSKDELTTFAKDNVSQTYGELLYPSVKKMISEFHPKESDVFLDLGSGLGKCALQVFTQSPVKKVIGIEASTGLFNQSKLAEEKLKNDFPFFWNDNRVLDLRCANFLTDDWQDTTVIYTCSTCFTQNLLAEIGRKINQHTSVQQVLSLRPLPTLERLKLQNVFSVECSWDSSLCFHYAL